MSDMSTSYAAGTERLALADSDAIDELVRQAEALDIPCTCFFDSLRLIAVVNVRCEIHGHLVAQEAKSS